MSNSLQRFIGAGKKVRIERSFPSNPILNGFVIDASEDLCVMHCFHDFMPDGFSLFHIADVTSVRSGEYERHWERMLAGEGLLSALAKPPSLELETMESAINSIAAQYGGITVECEDAGNESEDFYIGSVVSSNSSEIVLRHFDGLGVWDDELSTISLNSISLVQFDTPYTNIFWKYLREPSAIDNNQ